VGLGYALSVFFLVRNLYPVIKATERKAGKSLLVLVVVLHAGLAVAIKILFFAHASPARKGEVGNAKDGARG
jgi:protein YIPF1/2